MMKEVTPVEIRGHKYTGRYIPASEACAIAYKLARVLGGEGDVSNLVFSENENLVLSILSYTLRDGVAINASTFDEIYTANLGELMDALKFAVEVNFADFLGENVTGILNGGVKAQTLKK